MIDIEQTIEERNIKRIILLGSTFVVLIVTLIIAYLLISSEVREFRNHLNTFKSTLLKREKSAIKSVVKNFINDIKYEEDLRQIEIKKRVKNQTTIITRLLMYKKKLTKDEVIKTIKDLSFNEKLDFLVLNFKGELLYHSSGKLPRGTNVIDLKDVNGKKFIKKIIDKNGFVEYFWFAPKSNKISKKIVYAMKLEKLGIIIANGEFLETEYSLNNRMLSKIEKENFSKNDFIFIYEIMSLSSSKNYSKLILEKNIITDEEELVAIENVLQTSDYKGDIFYEYNKKLIYSAFLSDERTFISAGVDLSSIEKIIQYETSKSHKNLENKIYSLIFNIVVIVIVFFLLSYLMAKRVENMFKKYRLRIANSQQLLIQKSKMASMGEMIGNIAHQWRQPLTQLSGIFLDVETAHAHNELDTNYLEKRTNQANDLLEYMSKTIDDFKEFYNPNVKEECFNLKQTIKNALKIIDSSLKFYQIDVVLHVDDSLHVKGLANEFSQVVLNIITNAKDIAISRKIENPKIEIRSELFLNKISLHVEDNCGGIKEQNIQKIFEPYYTTKYKYGTGIGLYMSKIIIESKMGGKLLAENIDKNGAKFTIVLLKVTNKFKI